MPDPLFQTLFDDTETAPWAPAGVVRDRARRRARRAKGAAVAAVAVAVVLVLGGVAVAGRDPAPGLDTGASPSALPGQKSHPSTTSPKSPINPTTRPPGTEPTALVDGLFLAPGDVGPDYRVAAPNEWDAGDWTFESSMSMLGCPSQAQTGQLDRRDRTLVPGTRTADGFTQYVARHRPGDAARYFERIRAEVAACTPGGGRSIRIDGQRFAGQDALLVLTDVGGSVAGRLVLIRQGDLVTQYFIGSDRDSRPTLEVARRAADRLCGGTPVC